VFVFHAHVNQGDDRCGGTDRQRKEIRARATDIVAQNSETVHYSLSPRIEQGIRRSALLSVVLDPSFDEIVTHGLSVQRSWRSAVNN
jgi:hypothetical protein